MLLTPSKNKVIVRNSVIKEHTAPSSVDQEKNKYQSNVTKKQILALSAVKTQSTFSTSQKSEQQEALKTISA